tara:strand:+ start:13 stop:291 length:279 start_codon:yes stop_codon:yes gene_type:complete
MSNLLASWLDHVELLNCVGVQSANSFPKVKLSPPAIKIVIDNPFIICYYYKYLYDLHTPTFFTGGPGSKWSGVAQEIEWMDKCNESTNRPKT